MSDSVGTHAAPRPDLIVILTDQERAPPPYESAEIKAWRREALSGRRWFLDQGVDFVRHYTGSLACVPSRPTLLTGHYPDVHGATQTDGIGKHPGDPEMRWLRPFEVPTLGNWFRAAGYDTHYDGKWHASYADLIDPITGKRLATNTASGKEVPGAVQAYLSADPLAAFGFSGWVGPEPHGPRPADIGLVRDPLIARRIVAWLKERYARRRGGDIAASKPFLLVASFVNPHDICFFPAWAWRSPVAKSVKNSPSIAPAPTGNQTVASLTRAQAAYRDAYFTAYGPGFLVAGLYKWRAQAYRNLYYRLHAAVDDPIDQVRRAVTEGGSEDALIVRTSDHGELLGAHGGLHQKWFNLYEEATRVPFTVAGIGRFKCQPQSTFELPTSHVDLLPTLLGAAGLGERQLAQMLRRSFSEVHDLPGKNLMPYIYGHSAPDPSRSVYMMTRDNVLAGSADATLFWRRLGMEHMALPPRIRPPRPAEVDFEAIVVRVGEDQARGGAGHTWKIVRAFTKPKLMTGLSQVAAARSGGRGTREEQLFEEWELYDLSADPCEANNLYCDANYGILLVYLKNRLETERVAVIPKRNRPWPAGDSAT